MKEEFMYSDFVSYIPVESKILKGVIIRKEIFVCPICEGIHLDIKHGESISCCNIIYSRWRNSLEVIRCGKK